jgi:hypothetical protein
VHNDLSTEAEGLLTKVQAMAPVSWAQADYYIRQSETNDEFPQCFEELEAANLNRLLAVERTVVSGVLKAASP